MTTPRVARDGVVRHPLTGRLEFESTDHGLAAHVATTLDRYDPASVDVVFRMLYEVPPAQRRTMQWVAPLSVVSVLMEMQPGVCLAATAGEPPLFLAGRPLVVDDTAEGLSIRIGVDA